MRIGEVAAAAGVSTRSLRYYEEMGLLTSQRRPSGQRDYGWDAVERVKWVQSLYAAGLGSKAIAKLMPCIRTGVATDDMLGELAAERDRMTAQIDELIQTRDRLTDIYEATKQPGSRECPAAGHHRPAATRELGRSVPVRG